MLCLIWNGFLVKCKSYQHLVRHAFRWFKLATEELMEISFFAPLFAGDHTTSLWQIRDSSFEHIRSFRGHTRSVKTAAFRRTDPACFATGGRDGAILIWDTRSNAGNQTKADNSIFSGHAGGPGTPHGFKRKATRQTPKLPPLTSSSSITGLAFQVSDRSSLILKRFKKLKTFFIGRMNIRWYRAALVMELLKFGIFAGTTRASKRSHCQNTVSRIRACLVVRAIQTY